MRLPVLLLAFAVAAAGCAGAPGAPKKTYSERTITALLPSGVAAANLTQDQYYFVLVSGSEHAERIRGDAKDPHLVCSRTVTFTYDRDARTVRFDPSVHPLDVGTLRVLVIVDYWGVKVSPGGLQSGCPTRQILSGYPARATLRDPIRSDLEVSLVVEPQNGLVTYNGTHFVLMGKKLHVNLTRLASSDRANYYVTGDFEVANLGAWDKAGLSTATNPGARPR